MRAGQQFRGNLSLIEGVEESANTVRLPQEGFDGKLAVTLGQPVEIPDQRLRGPGRTDIAQGVRQILDLLGEQAPESGILLLGTFPRGESPHAEARLNNAAVNQLIRHYADGDRIHYLDIGRKFVEPDGTLKAGLFPDDLHLSPRAYRIWAEAMEPKLREFGL